MSPLMARLYALNPGCASKIGSMPSSAFRASSCGSPLIR